MSSMSGKSSAPAGAGWETEAGVSGWGVCAKDDKGNKKRAISTSASDSLMGFVDYARLIAAIVRLIMSAWQAFGAHQHTRHRSCFRASTASR